jgi:Tfp pilus assembly protein PilF
MEAFLGKYHKILLITIIMGCFLCFKPLTRADFINYDDPDYVTKNALIKTLKSDRIAYYFTHKTTDLFVPLVFVSYALDFKIFGMNASGFHLTNILLHLLNVIFVFFLVRSLARNWFYPFIITALFAFHPLHVESIAWITERKDLLYSFFFLLAFFSWHKYRQKNKLSFLILSLCLFILSCLSKPMAITFPAAIVLYDHFYAKLPLLKNILRYLPFALVSLLFFYISVHFIDTSVRGSVNTGYSGVDKLFVPFYGLGFYLVKLCFPFYLSVIYPYAEKTGGMLPLTYLLSPLLVGFVCWFVFLSKRSSPEIKAGFLFFILSMLPVLQIIPNNFTVAADRYVYLPCLGLFFLAAFFIKRYSERRSPGSYTIPLFTVIVITTYASLTYIRTRVWNDSITLFSDVIAKYNNAEAAYHNRGVAYNAKGDFQSALPDLEKSVKLNPASADAWSNYGWTLSALRKYPDAINALEKSVSINPNVLRSQNDLGNTYGVTGRFDLALKHLLIAEKIEPDNPSLNNNIAYTYQQIGETDKAISYYQKAARLGLKEARELLMRNNLAW